MTPPSLPRRHRSHPRTDDRRNGLQPVWNALADAGKSIIPTNAPQRGE